MATCGSRSRNIPQRLFTRFEFTNCTQMLYDTWAATQLQSCPRYSHDVATSLLRAERRTPVLASRTRYGPCHPVSATAQVAPVGGHHLTTGPAAASANVSPSGAYSTSVPLDLPAGRGSIPIPLSIVYNGSSRVGAAGAGWEVPLSFVRRSQSTMRRKPRWGLLDFSQTPRAAERVVMSLAGVPQYMAPTSDPNVFTPGGRARRIGAAR
jgi:hypothetical protein